MSELTAPLPRCPENTGNHVHTVCKVVIKFPILSRLGRARGNASRLRWHRDRVFRTPHVPPHPPILTLEERRRRKREKAIACFRHVTKLPRGAKMTSKTPHGRARIITQKTGREQLF